MLRIVFVMLLLTLTSACSENKPLGVMSHDDVEAVNVHEVSEFDQAALLKSNKEKSKYLAYVHHLSVEFEKAKLASAHRAVISACEKDIKYECTILSDDYSSGEYSSGRIQLRVKPEGVPFFSNLASQEGDVATQSKQAEDLSLSILDTAKRIEQLERFEKKLIALESRADADIDSLLKVASQLSETQTQLEYLQGSKATLLQRVQTDILNINLKLKYETSFFNSIGDAFGDFGEEFTYAIEGLIGSIAYIIPWTIFLMLMFFIVRAIFRFLNIKVFRGKQKNNDGTP